MVNKTWGKYVKLIWILSENESDANWIKLNRISELWNMWLFEKCIDWKMNGDLNCELKVI